MRASVDFLAGLLDDDEPCVAAEDLAGEHRPLFTGLSALSVICVEPSGKRFAACPHCDDGAPYQLGERILCNACRSEISPQHLQRWQLDRDAFLRWFASSLNLRGEVRRIDERLWQLGTWTGERGLSECFYRRRGDLSAEARRRLAAYRSTIVFGSVMAPPTPSGLATYSFSLSEVVTIDERLSVITLETLLRPRGAVRFSEATGTLQVGDAVVGEVGVGSKEFFLLRLLARHLDSFLAYSDLKREVLASAGSTDTTEEATFCHKLKSRIKKTIPQIDRLLVTTNKADGYRLRRTAEL